MVGIDLFAGAGGMSLGAQAAGIDVSLAVEVDPRAAAAYRANHPSTTVFEQDVRTLSARHLRRISRGRNGTILFGGPPCQGFSYSNTRTRKRANPNNWLFLEFLRVLRIWRPDWVVFENVKGIKDTANGLFLANVLEQLDECGYSVSDGVLDAADYGVPQHRERLFVVGSRCRIKPVLPKPNCRTKVTVRDAIGDLPKLENGAMDDWKSYRSGPKSDYATTMRGRLTSCSGHLVTRNAPYVLCRYRHIPQGGNWESIPARLMQNYADRTRCHTGIYYRLRASRPSIVIGNYRKNMLLHPWQDRGLSVREAARIQSFPDWYEFNGSVGFQQQQVGNAVPPLLAKTVFKAITNAMPGTTLEASH